METMPRRHPHHDHATAFRRGRLLYVNMMVLATAALACALQATFSCQFAQRQIEPYPQYDVKDMCNATYFTTLDTMQACTAFFNSPGIGFYHWHATTMYGESVCFSYDMPVPLLGWVRPQFDTAFHAAFGFSIVSFCFLFFGWFTIVMATCCPMERHNIKGVSIYFGIATLCQALSFLIFASNVCAPGFFHQYFPLVNLQEFVQDVHCSLGGGSILGIAATCLSFACMILAPISIPVTPFGYQNEQEKPWQDDDEEAPLVPRNQKGPLKIIIAGAPASGKGTQCEVIQEKFGVVHLSTGDMLRAAVAAGTKVGTQAKEYMDSGRLVPDHVIIGVVKDRLSQPDCQQQGWLLDGFPRTEAQAKALEEEGITADVFLFLNVPGEVLVERVVGRRTDPVTGKIYHMTFSRPNDPEVEARLEQRSDDTEEKVKVRLQQFHANVDAVKDSYTDISVIIDGNRSPALVSENVVAAIHTKVSPRAIKIIIAGAPASGKGTQCEVIKEKFGVVHLSTGDMLRAAVAAGTKVGKEAQEYMDSGRLVPDDVIIGVVKDRLSQPDCQQQGWLLDGFPRTQAQAKALEEAGIVADVFLFLNVPDEVLVERVVGRRTDPVDGKIYHMVFSPPNNPEVEVRLEQRSDDTEEKVKVRLQQFHANVDAVKDSYTEISAIIDGNRSPSLVSENVIDAIHARLSPV
ncbi:Adenylate kinase (Fragment) [Seminavis robusta]|uniref:Adenylate kinase n=1 Tax=Seminavis robusta TaxID=568900 RepID=A0A9N8DII5_9STRA